MSTPLPTQELLLQPGEAPLAELLERVAGSPEEERAGWARAQAVVAELAEATRGVLTEQAHLLSYHPRERAEILLLAAASFSRQSWADASLAEIEQIGLPLIEGIVLAVAAGRPLAGYIEAVYEHLSASHSSGDTPTHSRASLSSLRRGQHARESSTAGRRE